NQRRGRCACNASRIRYSERGGSCRTQSPPGFNPPRRRMPPTGFFHSTSPHWELIPSNLPNEDHAKVNPRRQRRPSFLWGVISSTKLLDPFVELRFGQQLIEPDIWCCYGLRSRRLEVRI